MTMSCPSLLCLLCVCCVCVYICVCGYKLYISSITDMYKLGVHRCIDTSMCMTLDSKYTLGSICSLLVIINIFFSKLHYFCAFTCTVLMHRLIITLAIPIKYILNTESMYIQ